MKINCSMSTRTTIRRFRCLMCIKLMTENARSEGTKLAEILNIRFANVASLLTVEMIMTIDQNTSKSLLSIQISLLTNHS